MYNKCTKASEAVWAISVTKELEVYMSDRSSRMRAILLPVHVRSKAVRTPDLPPVKIRSVFIKTPNRTRRKKHLKKNQ